MYGTKAYKKYGKKCGSGCKKIDKLMEETTSKTLREDKPASKEKIVKNILGK